jgi:DNA-directed RNA polymerase subunit RPC12/RpoP
MNVYIYISLNCSECGTETLTHETGLNEYNVYPCEKCYPETKVLTE